MRIRNRLLTVGVIPVVLALTPVLAQQHGQGQHDSRSGHALEDTREFVKIPEPLASHMLANMRDHLVAISEIQAALGAGKHNEAAKVAEERLGMTSLSLHGADHVAGFMPQGMRDAGNLMHRTASRFAIVVKDAEVQGDLKPALATLSEVTRACAGCHAGYRTK